MEESLEEEMLNPFEDMAEDGEEEYDDEEGEDQFEEEFVEDGNDEESLEYDMEEMGEDELENLDQGEKDKRVKGILA